MYSADLGLVSVVYTLFFKFYENISTFTFDAKPNRLITNSEQNDGNFTVYVNESIDEAPDSESGNSMQLNSISCDFRTEVRFGHEQLANVSQDENTTNIQQETNTNNKDLQSNSKQIQISRSRSRVRNKESWEM